MKIDAKSWPEKESVFEFANRATLTAETEEEAKVLGLVIKILRDGSPESFKVLLTEYLRQSKNDS